MVSALSVPPTADGGPTIPIAPVRILTPRAAVAELLVLLALASNHVPGQVYGTPQHGAALNRIFLVTPPELRAWNLDGTLAWASPLPTPVVPTHSYIGLVVDGHGHVWLGDPNPSSWRVARYSAVTGSMDLVVPTAGWPCLLAVDRHGHCYVTTRNGPAAGPLLDHVVKIDPGGQILWDVDLSGQALLSTPPALFTTDIDVDGEGNIWVKMLGGQGTGGGRMIKLAASSGAVLWSIQLTGRSLAITPRGEVWTTDSGNCPIPLVTNPILAFDLNGQMLAWGANSYGVGDEIVAMADSTLLYHGMATPAVMVIPTNWWAWTPVGANGLGSNALSSFTVPSAPGGSIPGLRVAIDGNGDLWSFCTGPVIPPNLGITLIRLAGPDYFASSLTQQYAFFPGSGLTSGLSASNEGTTWTIYNYANIIDPWGDLDGDGEMNRNELLARTNPCDAASNSAQLAATGLFAGQTALLALSALGDAGLPYATILSLTPGVFDIHDGRALPLNPSDPLALWSIAAGNGAVSGVLGTLDAQGAAAVTIAIPNMPALAGLNVHIGFFTLSALASQGIKTIFGPRTLMVQ